MANLASLSLVKREKLRKEARLQRLKEMREDLPNLTVNEIRRNRIPLHEALIQELHEDGYLSSAHFISQLIEYQNHQIEYFGQDSKIGLKPRLTNSPEYAQKLYDTLKQAEDAHYEGDNIKEYDILQELGIFFAYGPDDWWWLGEQIFIQCLEVVNNIVEDGGKRNATCQYLFGRFQLIQNEDVEQSMPHLDSARTLSEGRFWTVKLLLKNSNFDSSKEDTIYCESCKLLYKALMIVAERTKKSDPLYTAKLCSIARKRANEACYYKGEAEAYMLKGSSEFEGGEYDAAILSFYKALRKHIKSRSLDGICQTRILLQRGFIKLNKPEQAFESLKLLLKFSTEHSLTYYTGLAYRYIGEFYINQGKPSAATPNLLKSLNILHSVNVVSQIEQVRNFAAISTGQELMTKYIKLIINVGEESKAKGVYLYKALGWKDSRDQFWSDDEMSVSSYMLGSASASVEGEEDTYGDYFKMNNLPTEPDDDDDDDYDND